jgi:hypothetical protein
MPLIQLGHNELQSRFSKRISRLTLSVGGLSLLIAALALYFSIETKRASSDWENKQLDALNRISITFTEKANQITTDLKSTLLPPKKESKAKPIKR